ncbi:MAG: hypothetical protein DRH33_05540 [Candidatus Nealsonbacteria bacterium]|nr:MAG: hypothetical protein DRH33_05540 [Candidatus Nealsonbacteria bacterium]
MSKFLSKVFGVFFTLLGRGIVALIPILLALWLFGLFWGKEMITLQKVLEVILGKLFPGILVADWMIGVSLLFLILLIGTISTPLSRQIYRFVGRLIQHALQEKIKEQRQGTVVFEYFRKGIWVVGIVVGYLEGSEQLKGGRILKVFVPSVPVILTGLAPIFIQEKDVIYIDLPVDELLNTFISGGLIAPTKIPELVAELDQREKNKEELNGD